MKKYRELWHNHRLSWLRICDFTNEQKGEEVIVKTTHSLISHGSERLVTSSRLSKEAGQVMRIPHMKGDFANQFTYGYSLVGEVLAGPKDIVGKQVHLLHPHQEMAFVHTNEVTVIPDGIPSNVATLASNMETAINANWDAGINMGDRVLIIGYGVIGALIASQVVKYPGVKLTVFELDEERAAKAVGFGLSVVRSDNMLDSDYDIAFNCSGSEAGLQIGIDKTIVDGKIIELSWYGSRQVLVDLGNAFHYGRKQIISSQVGRIPRQKQHNWDFKKRKKLVFDLLKQPGMIELVKNEIQFDESPEFYKKLRNGRINQFSTVINYNS